MYRPTVVVYLINNRNSIMPLVNIHSLMKSSSKNGLTLQATAPRIFELVNLLAASKARLKLFINKE